MIRDDEYLTIKGTSSGTFKDRGSKFIAFVRRVQSVDDVKKELEEIRKEYRDARHHCYAYKIGTGEDNWRVNDDGEPSGSAGKPILGQINSYEITNVLIVVIRYFGGTLLGVGGLINAYRSAAREALENNTIVSEQVMEKLQISFPYEAMNDVMKVIKDENLEQSNQVFELQCSLTLGFRASKLDIIHGRLNHIEGVIIEK